MNRWLKNYEVTVQYVDFPMGASPAYRHISSLTKTEAEKKAKELNENSVSTGSVYPVYAAKQTE